MTKEERKLRIHGIANDAFVRAEDLVHMADVLETELRCKKGGERLRRIAGDIENVFHYLREVAD